MSPTPMASIINITCLAFYSVSLGSSSPRSSNLNLQLAATHLLQMFQKHLKTHKYKTEFSFLPHSATPLDFC